MSGIVLAYGEYFQGKIHPASLEILTPLSEISNKLNKKLVLLVLAEDWQKVLEIEELHKALCDEVWIVASPELREFKDDLYSRVLVEIIKREKPYGVFFPATIQGTAIAPRVAGALEVGLCAHVNALSLEGETLYMYRPTYGDNIIASLYSTTYPIMATLSLGAFVIKENLRTPQIRKYELGEDFTWQSKIKVRKIKLGAKEINRLSVAKVVLAGGLGLKKRENLEALRELAKILNAEVGVTRPLYYAGWATEREMIGVSGVSVRPKLYIGFGISGAIQHTQGMENSEFIIAVNTDKEAPLVKMAHLSLIGDAGELIKALLKYLKRGA
ncbi:MAG: electron transfer flavoprotein subunit alpha/FixB family protein [Caldimicrobium sp.]